MRDYEVTIVLQPQLEGEAKDQLVERIEGWLTQGEGEEAIKPEEKHWGKKRLAYPIKNHRDGLYLHYEAALDPESIRDIEQNILYTEDILRHLVVRKEA